jgi:hypothetical protein
MRALLTKRVKRVGYPTGKKVESETKVLTKGNGLVKKITQQIDRPERDRLAVCWKSHVSKSWPSKSLGFLHVFSPKKGFFSTLLEMQIIDYDNSTVRMKMTLRVTAIAACSAAALALTASTAQSANLLVDPGFESGAPAQPNPILIPGGVGGGWAVFNGATFSTNHPEFGTSSLQGLQGAGVAWNFEAAYQVLGGVSSGQRYTLSADYMTTTGLGTYAGAYIQMTYFNSAGADIGTVETGGTGARALNFNPAVDNTWYSATVTATAPAGAAYVAPYLAFMMNGTQISTVNLYWDNGSIAVVPEPSSLPLLGLSLVSALIWRRRQ